MPISVTVIIITWLAWLFLCWFTPDGPLRQIMRWLPPVGVIVCMALFNELWAPWEKLLVSTVGMLCAIKASLLLQISRHSIRTSSKLGFTAFMTVWPGMDPTAFVQRTDTQEDGQRFLQSFLWMTAGLALGLLLSISAAHVDATVLGALGILSLLLLIHFGYAQILTIFVRLAGFPVSPLFRTPFRSRSLQDFWSRRWNLAFVDMNKRLFLKPLYKRFGRWGGLFGVFLISGAFHELAISYPAGGGWGLPLGYFLLQAMLISTERLLRVEKTWLAPLARVWTWMGLLLPAFLIFHEPFRTTLILPLFEYTHVLLTQHDLKWWFSTGLWIAAFGNFCTMGAGLQLPHRMEWRTDLTQLKPFNRKILWNYGFFILLLIITFGSMTLIYHDAMIEGDREALGIATLIGGFWGLRLLVDFIYFDHNDWPTGPLFNIGHVMLNFLFFCMTGTYLGLVAWHTWLS